MKYSIIACAYANSEQFKNFLLTAASQTYKDKYEIIIGDNATPNSRIFDACFDMTLPENCSLGYFRITPEKRTVDNNTQGLNICAREAVGDNLVIVVDSNVLISYNMLEEIDKLMKANTFVTSSECDVKLSPKGTKESEYEVKKENEEIVKENMMMLRKLDWPQDPMKFNLDLVPHRFPTPHQKYDVYVCAINRIAFLESGGYDETDSKWGRYHHNKVEELTKKYNWKKLSNVIAVHQYHRVYKSDKCLDNYVSRQFEIMQCRRT